MSGFVDSLPAATDISQSRRDYKKPIAYIIRLALVLCVVCSAVFYIHGRIMALDLGYKIAAASKSLDELKQENMRLNMELSRLANPERIEKIAREKLNMTGIHHSQIIKVKSLK